MTVTEDNVPPPAMISEHPAHHPGHRLNRVANDGRFFICDGCMEHGAGTRYRCEHERCNFDLHTCCAVAPETLTHPMFRGCVFLFLREPPPATTSTTAGGNKGGGRACIACGEDVRGFVYHCFDDDDDGIDLHPCCARLPEHAILNDRVLSLGRQAYMSHDDGKGSREIHRPAAARYRQWAGAGRQAGGQDHPRTENAQPNVRVFELRQETSRPRDMPNDRNRGREHRAPAARHRSPFWWKR